MASAQVKSQVDARSLPAVGGKVYEHHMGKALHSTGVGINVLYVEKDPYTVRVILCKLIPVLYGSFYVLLLMGLFYVRGSLYYMGLFYVPRLLYIWVDLIYDSTHST